MRIRRQRVRDEARRQAGRATDVVIPGPERDHLAVRQRAHRLRHAVPILRPHGVPDTRIHQQAAVPFEHEIEPLPAQRLRNGVPLGEMHVVPERPVRTEIVRRRGPRHLLAIDDVDNRRRSAVDPEVQDVQRLNDRRRGLQRGMHPRQAAGQKAAHSDGGHEHPGNKSHTGRPAR